MKANRKMIREYLNDDEAVSPVIAVILMVAITVVLAATVFVLVSDLGGDVGKTGPKLSMVTDTTSSTTKWIVKVTDATQSADITDYQFVMATPTHGTFVFDPTETSWSTTAEQCRGDAGNSTATSRTAGVCDTGTVSHSSGVNDYQLIFLDVSGDGKYNTLDTITITYDTTDAGQGANAFVTGSYKIDIRHKTSNTVSGSVEQGF